MGEVVKILGCAHFKENLRSTNTQWFVFNKQKNDLLPYVEWDRFVTLTGAQAE
jgi:hypothetical protein